MNLNEKGLAPLIIVLVIAVLAGAGFLGYSAFQSKNTTVPVVPSKQQIKPNPSVKPKTKAAAPRSQAPGIVTTALTAQGFNPKTGSAIKLDKYFSPKDKQIYLLMNVNKPKVGTRIEYVRYLSGKYLDHKSIKVSQPNWKYAYFGWSAKPGKEHKKGIYRVRIYTNGILEKKLNYLIRS